MKTIYELYEWNLKMRKVHQHGFDLLDGYGYETRFGGNSFAIVKDFTTGIRVGGKGDEFVIEKILNGNNYVVDYSLSFEEAKTKSIAYYDMEVAKLFENI